MQLNNLVKDERHKELKDLNLTIQNVHILEPEMKLILTMSTPNIVINESIIKLEEMFSSMFEAFEVIVNLIYEDNFKSDFIIEDFIYYIKDITIKKYHPVGHGLVILNGMILRIISFLIYLIKWPIFL